MSYCRFPVTLSLATALAIAACQSHDAIAPGSAAVATIALSATAVIVDPGATLTVAATPRDNSGNALTGRTVAWVSSKPAIATVSGTGFVTAIVGGVTTITATVEGKTAEVTITVRSPTPPPPVDTVSLLGPWTVVLNRPLSTKYEGVAFPDSLNGWVMSDQGSVLHSADGGVTWALQTTLAGHLRSMDFIDATHGFIGTLGGVLYRTTDGGVTWVDITSLLPRPPIGFCGITHVGNTVHVVGRYENATDYYVSHDGGTTWQYQNLGALAQGMVEVSFLNDSVGFIGGMSLSTAAFQGPATILKTTDGGNSWRTVFVHNGGPGWAWKLFPINQTLIYGSLESLDGIYRVVKSVDGGETWDVQIVATNQPLGAAGGLQGIGFLDANVGWVGGFFSGMYATTNGGVTWTHVTTSGSNVNRYRRAGNTLFTAGTQGILRYDALH